MHMQFKELCKPEEVHTLNMSIGFDCIDRYELYIPFIFKNMM